MLRRKALNRIYLTTLVLFVMLITLTFDHVKNVKNNDLYEVEYASNLDTNHIYLLNEDNYLVKVDILLDKGDILKKAKEILNNLSVNNKKYSNLKGIIPSNTKVNSIDYKNNVLTIDFSSDLLKVNEVLEEKVIEGIVYSMLELEGVEDVTIKIDGKNLEKLEKSNQSLPYLLNKELGINKDYDINRLYDTKKVVLYYYYNDSKNDYYVPVTKYVNSKDDKVKIIIDSLKGKYFLGTNLSSYLSYKTDIKNYDLDKDILTITFNSLNNENLEEVTYSLASSIFDSMDVKKVIFEVDDTVVSIKVKEK